MKKSNAYAAALGLRFMEDCPKAVLAAIAVSRCTTGGDDLEHAAEWVALEWSRLHAAGVVSQSPPGWLAPYIEEARRLEDL